MEELLQRIRERDQDALAELIARTWAPVYGVVVKRVDPETAQTATWDAYLKLWLCINQVRAETLIAWLRRVALNCAADTQRRHFRKRRDPSRTVSWTDLEDTSASDSYISKGADDHADAVCLRVSFAPLWATVRQEYRQLITWRAMGMPYNEMAALLGVPVGTVKSRVFQATRVARRKCAV